MQTLFIIIVSVVILQRLVEILIARANTKRLFAMGGYEVGSSHYKYLVLLHMMFFIGMILEVGVFHSTQPSFWKYTFAIFILAQIVRLWCLKSLGRYWNTRIIVLPLAQVIKKGPYRYLRHPNYVVVATELLVLPISFGAYWTALIASVLNAIILAYRIREEEAALQASNNYISEMSFIPRFIPFSWFKKPKI